MRGQDSARGQNPGVVQYHSSLQYQWQSKKQWCEENGISIRKFFYWQKKIRAGLYTEAKKDTANPVFLPKNLTFTFAINPYVAFILRFLQSLNPACSFAHCIL